jgi:hypothetical protein
MCTACRALALQHLRRGMPWRDTLLGNFLGADLRAAFRLERFSAF